LCVLIQLCSLGDSRGGLHRRLRVQLAGLFEMLSKQCDISPIGLETDVEKVAD
jgi:hypothetical protein